MDHNFLFPDISYNQQSTYNQNHITSDGLLFFNLLSIFK